MNLRKNQEINTFIIKYLNIDTLILTLISGFIFFSIISGQVSSDIIPHIKYLQDSLDKQTFPFPPLYYLTIYILSFIVGTDYILIVVFFVLLLSVLSKFILTKYIINQLYLTEPLANSPRFIKSIIFGSLLAIVLIIPIYFEGNFYLGKIFSNVWHNSTTIFVMPFVLALHLFSLKFLDNQDNKYLGWILVFSIINILIKPSFFFVFCVVFPLIILFKQGLTGNLLKVGAIMTIACLVLSVEYYFIYQTGELDNILYNGRKSGIAIIPFNFWREWNSSFFTTFIASTAFPVVVIISLWNEIKKDVAFQYTIWLFSFAMIIAILITETGTRSNHGNFIWQAVICLYLLNLHSLGILLRKIAKDNKITWKTIPSLLIYSWSLFSAVIYLVNSLLTESYL